MAKLDQKFKKKSAQRFDDEEIMMSDRKANKRARRDSRQKDDIYALVETSTLYGHEQSMSAHESNMHF